MKKGDLSIGLFILIIGVLATLLVSVPIYNTFFKAADPLIMEQACKATVLARDISGANAAATQTKGISGSIGATPPLACQTASFSLPSFKASSSSLDARKFQVKWDMAELMARCWDMFGEGKVDNPFLESALFEDQCFMCHTFTIDSLGLKGEEEISSNEFQNFLFKTAYDLNSEDACFAGGGECVASKEACSDGDARPLAAPCDTGKNFCCVKKNRCENVGGTCKQLNTGGSGEALYSDVNCGPGLFCYVPEEKSISYAEYIQFFGGKGSIAVIDDAFNNKDEYGVMFVGSKEQCTSGACQAITGGDGAGGALLGIGLVAFTIGTGGVGPIALAAGAGAIGAAAATAGVAVGADVFETPPQAIFVGKKDELVKACPRGLVTGVGNE